LLNRISEITIWLATVAESILAFQALNKNIPKLTVSKNQNLAGRAGSIRLTIEDLLLILSYMRAIGAISSQVYRSMRGTDVVNLARFLQHTGMIDTIVTHKSQAKE